MRIFGTEYRRHCYDKPRRCPGWAGGGWRHPAEDKYVCSSGSLDLEGRWWRWRIHTCTECGTRALPVMIQKLDYTWWVWRIYRKWDDFTYWLEWKRRGR